MRKLLCYCLAGLLASCAAQKALPQLSEEQKRANERGLAYRQPDSASLADTTPHTPRWAMAVPPAPVDSIVIEPHRTLLDKLLGRKSEPYTVGLAPTRIGKKSTVNVYNAPATVTTTTLGKKSTGAVGAGASIIQTGKKSGDIIKADSGAIVNKVGGPGNAQTTRGNNNTPQLTAPVQQAADWKATLAKPVGIVLGLLLLFIILKRRKSLSNNA